MKNGTFGQRLSGLMQSRGWSTYKLAELTQVSPEYISMLCTGVRNPSFETQRALAKAFGIKLEKLMEGVQ